MHLVYLRVLAADFCLPSFCHPLHYSCIPSVSTLLVGPTMLSSTHPHMRRQGANLGGWERPEVMQEAQAGRTNGRKEDLTRLLTLADEACKRLDMLNGTKGARGGRGEGSSPAPSVNGQNDPPRLHTRAVSARAAPRVPTTRVPADAPASGSAVATTEDVAATVQQPVATVSRKRIRSADDVAAASVTDRINAASLAPRKVTAKRVESACECIHAENHFNWCEHAEQACTDCESILCSSLYPTPMPFASGSRRLTHASDDFNADHVDMPLCRSWGRASRRDRLLLHLQRASRTFKSSRR